MKHKKAKFNALMLLGVGLTVQAQQATLPSGGVASGSGGTVSYSIGQVAYIDNTGSTGSVSQGVQQAFEIFSVGINETTLNISASVYPNPTNDNLTLQVPDFNNEKLIYQLFDVQGRLVESKPITAEKTQINMSYLPSATYLVYVSQNNKTVQTFKIIKH